MNPQSDDLVARLVSVERRLAHARLLAGAALAVALAALGAAIGARAAHPRPPDTLRVKAIVIEDEQGRERMVLGAPIPEPPGRREALTGLIIRDPAGAERFGLGLLADGIMNMGFDAPPVPGEDRNPERVDISTDPDGGSEMRFLDRTTRVRARIALDRENNVALEFLDFPKGEIVTRRFNLDGTVLQRERRE